MTRRHRATCIGEDPELFFPIGNTGPALLRPSVGNKELRITCSITNSTPGSRSPFRAEATTVTAVVCRQRRHASRTGMAHWFLSDPTASSRHCCQARWCWFPPRLHTPTPGLPAGQRAGSPASTMAGTPTSPRIPHKPRRRPTRLRRLCGHRPATPEPDDRQNGTVFDTPTRYKKEGLRPRFRRSEALSRTRWQVKDSNLRSFRDGFTDHGRRRADQRKRPFHRQLTCAFPTNSR